MGEFSYTAQKRDQSRVKGSLDASDRKEALRKLRAKGLSPIKVELAGKQGKEGKKRFGKSGVSAQEKDAKQLRRKLGKQHQLPFLERFSELYKSGLPIADALKILTRRLKNEQQKTLCLEVLRGLQEGKRFSDSLRSFPEVFPDSSVNLIEAGETTGNLDEVIDRLIAYLTERKSFKLQIITAMLYPGLLICMAIAVVAVFLFVMLPKIQPVFDNLGSELPLLTRFLVSMSDFLIFPGPLFILGFIVFIIGMVQWRKTRTGRMFLDRIFLRIWGLGPFLLYTESLKVSQTLGLLLHNGVTTVESLKLTESVLGNAYFKEKFREVRNKVVEGSGMASAMEGMGLLPDLMMDFIAVGENTGNLVPAFENVNRVYGNRLEQALKAFIAVSSLLILLGVFAFIAFIVIAVFSALWGMSTSL